GRIINKVARRAGKHSNHPQEGIDEEAAQRSASLHYNGNMKLWLELGIPDYKNGLIIYEEKYV
ncbi:hypothetical protein EJB05_16319, partial [Eragrostis curvula]